MFREAAGTFRKVAGMMQKKQSALSSQRSAGNMIAVWLSAEC
jgi:hypothetical protein